MSEIKDAIKIELETAIDKISLSEVIGLLVEVCIEKHEHLLINWQDKQAAKTWEYDAKQLGAALNKLKN